MILVLETRSNDPDFNASMDYLCVDLDREAAVDLLSLISLAEKLKEQVGPDLYRITFWGIHAPWNVFAYGADGAAFEEDDDKVNTFDDAVLPKVVKKCDDVLVMPPDFRVPQDMINAAKGVDLAMTEIVFGVDDDPHVRFSVSAKHTHVEVNTVRLSKSLIKEATLAAV